MEEDILKSIVNKFFDLGVKISSLQFFLRSVVIYILIGIMIFINEVVDQSNIEMYKQGYYIKTNWLGIYSFVMTIVLLILISSLIILQIGRLNDLGKKSGLVILTFVPLLNILFYLYLVLVKSKNNNNNIILNPEATEFSDNEADVGDVGDVVIDKDIKVNRKRIKKKVIVPIILVTVLISICVGFIFLYSPYNGKWEGELYHRLVLLEINDDEGRLLFYKNKSRSSSAENIFKIILFEKNKRKTILGIDGGSHKVRVDGDVLVLELDDLYSNLDQLEIVK